MINRDVAEAEFNRICDFVDVDLSYKQTDEEIKTFAPIKAKIIRGIECGDITVDADGRPTLNTKDGKQLVFNEPSCQTEKAMDRKGDNELVGKIIAACASLCDVPPVEISNLKKKDWGYCKALTTLFLVDG